MIPIVTNCYKCYELNRHLSTVSFHPRRKMLCLISYLLDQSLTKPLESLTFQLSTSRLPFCPFCISFPPRPIQQHIKSVHLFLVWLDSSRIGFANGPNSILSILHRTCFKPLHQSIPHPKTVWIQARMLSRDSMTFSKSTVFSVPALIETSDGMDWHAASLTGPDPLGNLDAQNGSPRGRDKSWEWTRGWSGTKTPRCG